MNAVENVELHPELRGVKAVLFDVGGTLTHPDWPRLAQIARAEAGRDFTSDELRRAMRETLRASGERVQNGGETPEEEKRRGWVFRGMYKTLGVESASCDSLSDCVDAAHTERHLWCGLDPEAPEVVGKLKEAGLRVAVISNTEDGRLEELMRLVGLAGSFDFMIDSFVVGARKPDAAIFRIALAKLGVEPRAAAYVGDSYAHDALAALAVGMRAILLDPLDIHPESVCPRIVALKELAE